MTASDGAGGHGGILPAFRQSATILERERPVILEAFEARLRASRSPLLADAQTSAQLMEQCASIIAEVAAVLRRGGSRADPRESDELAHAIGSARADRRVHPSESLRAAMELSEAALQEVTRQLGAAPPPEVAVVASTIQRATIERVARASVAYGGFLLARLQESHVDERRRIGRELHDRVAHSVAVVFRSLELLELYEVSDPDKAREKLALAKKVAQQALETTRNLSSELLHSYAEEGLEVALSEYLRLVTPPDVRAWVSVRGDEERLGPEVRNELFLILREAVRNAIEHSGARLVRVLLSVHCNEFEGVVEDDGRWLTRVAAARARGGTGLTSMRERAALLRGTLDLEQRPDGGTRVRVLVPLPATVSA